MATKGKRTQSVKLPEVGDVIEVTWRDSGCSSVRSGFSPDQLRTMSITNWGRVAYVGDEDLVFYYSETDLANSEMWAVWIPAILEIEILKKST